MERFLYRLSKSSHAEKFEAMVKLGILNSRMKDFFDVWLLLHQFDFDGLTLAAATMKTFATRGTDIRSEPIALTSAFAKDTSKATQWRGFVRKNRLTSVPGDFGEVIAAIAAFLGPIAKSLAEDSVFQATWRAPGPWHRLPKIGHLCAGTGESEGGGKSGTGWKYLDWFGYFWVDETPPWIYHYQHGWVYAYGESTNSIWFYTLDLGWFWTSDSYYPWIYVLNNGAWGIWD